MGKPGTPLSILPSSGLRLCPMFKCKYPRKKYHFHLGVSVASNLEQNLKISQASPLTILIGNMSPEKRLAQDRPGSKPVWNPRLLVPGPGLFLRLLSFSLGPALRMFSWRNRGGKERRHHSREESHWRRKRRRKRGRGRRENLTGSRMLLYILNYDVVHLKPI